MARKDKQWNSQWHREYYQKNREKLIAQSSNRRKKWRLEQLDKYGNKCACCPVTDSKLLRVDHDHKTGEIRGVLCTDCNIALGHVKDSVLILKNLIVYLEK